MENRILIKNIYYMLCYAYRVLGQTNFRGVETENFDDVQNLYAAILCRGISQLLKQGLYREYESHVDDIPSLRGHVIMSGTVRNKIARRRLLNCEYDELSENNIYNQILKSSMTRLLRSPQVDTGSKNTLKREILYFSGVDTIELSRVSWSRITFQRSNRVYEMLINICRLLFEGRLLTTMPGEENLLSLEDLQMSSLYEKFVLGYYSVHYPQLRPTDAHIPWALDGEGMYPEELYTMHTDATLRRGGDVLIIDTKFHSRITHERFGANKLSAPDLYQIFAYVKNEEAGLSGTEHNVSGMLLYARTDEDYIPDNSYMMSGNRIDVKTLDLNADFSEIRDRLDAIIRDFFGPSCVKASEGIVSL